MRGIVILLLLSISYPLNNYKLPEDTSLTLNNVWKEINKVGILYPHIVYAQCRLETGNLTHVYNNNLFGFTSNKYMIWDSWEKSIKYYKEWQMRKYKGGDYYQFLIRIKFAEDKNYTMKLKQFKN
jgi:hypothetical protein